MTDDVLHTSGFEGRRPSAQDVVELTIPVQADLVVLARLTAATMASRAGFDVEEIEDLRLAVEELCLSLVHGDADGRLCLRYVGREGTIEIACTLEPSRAGSGSENGSSIPEGERADDLSARILDALVDEHGRDSADGHLQGWLRKRRAGLQS